MSESAAQATNVPRSQYKSQIPQLRTELLAVQEQLRPARFPVLVVFGGVVGAGKSETINLLNQWLDPRVIATHAFDAPRGRLIELEIEKGVMTTVPPSPS